MNEATFFVGTYADAGDKGIFLYRADFQSREFTRVAAHAGTPNPSYLLRHRSGLLYAVEELAQGGNVSAYTVDEAGIHKGRTLASQGADPCHLALDDGERFLFAANYSGGSLAMFALDEEGMPQALCCLMQHEGKGTDPVRQEGPHVHCAQVVDGLVYVSDLGLDTVFCYRLDAERKTLEPTGQNIRLPDGHGPRHLCFHPVNHDWLYVIAELSAHVFVYHREGGQFVLRQEIPSLPEGAPEDNRAGAIKFSDDGAYLYVSNRGSDTITAFALTGQGLLELRDICASGGQAPRDFTPFGDHLVIANQDSSTLSVLYFDRKSGRFADLSMREAVGQPVCILKTQTP